MKFSIIVPVYNVAPWLDECLGSVARQQFGDWECICVDDGSADASAEILDAWAKRDARFRVVRQPNAGVAAARNRGLALAAGEYVWFVDGDDVVAVDALAGLAEAIDANGRPDIVQFHLRRFADGESFGGKDGSGGVVAYDLTKGRELRLAFRRHAQWLLGSSAVYRLAVYGKDTFAPLRNGEDSLWGRRAFYKARSLVYVDYGFYGYRIRRGGASNVWTWGRWREDVRLVWTMTKEGLRVRGLFWPVFVLGLRYAHSSWLNMRKVLG